MDKEVIRVGDIGELVTPVEGVGGDRKAWGQVRKEKGELMALYLHSLARSPADSSLKFLQQFLARVGLDQVTDTGSEAGEVLFYVGCRPGFMFRIMDEKVAEVRGFEPYVVYGISMWAGGLITFFKWSVDESGQVSKLFCDKYYRIMKDKIILPVIRGILSSVRPLRGREGVRWEYMRDNTLGTKEEDDLEDEVMYDKIKEMLAAGVWPGDIMRATTKPGDF